MAITLRGIGAQTTVAGLDDQTRTPALPASVAANDLILILVSDESSVGGLSATPPSATGYTELANQQDTNPVIDRRFTVLYKKAGASESDPTVTTNGYGAANSVTLACETIVYIGVDTTTPFDVTVVQGSNAAATTFTPTGVTTVTDNAVALSIITSSDTNALALLAGSEQGFAAQISGASYDWTTGNNGAHGLADKTIASASAVTFPTWNQTASASDSWAYISTALRPAATVVTTIDMWGQPTNQEIPKGEMESVSYGLMHGIKDD